MNLREENARLRAELKVANNKIGDLREEVARLQDVNDAHEIRFRELQGVPADCVLVPLTEGDMQVLLDSHSQGTDTGRLTDVLCPQLQALCERNGRPM